MKQKLIIMVIAIIVASFIFLYVPKLDKHSNEPCLANPTQKGTIIILNGVSSVGKMSLQKALQESMDEPYVAYGMDKLSLPEKDFTGDFVSREKPSKVRGMHGCYEQDTDGQLLYKFTFGPAAHCLVQGMHKSIAALADEMNNVVVDYVLYDPDWLAHLVDTLYGYHVYLVGVKAPLDVIEQRERKRGTSPQGHGRAYYNTVHKQTEYDIIVDTSELTPQEAAQKIKEHIHDQQPKALGRLYKELVGDV